MLNKRAWIPAIAAIAIIVGCDNKPTDRVPTSAPTAIKEPHEVLRHLQYVAVRKDFKHLSLIAPVDPEVVYGSAWWFNKHAGDVGSSLTEAEIDALGVGDLRSMGYLAPDISRKDLQENLEKLELKKIPQLPANMQNLDPEKLDQLPNLKFPNGKPNSSAEEIKNKYGRAALNAGLFRLTKVVPADVWPDLAVMEVKKNPNNLKVQNVFLGYQGTTVLEVGLYQNTDGNFGVSYLHYKVGMKKLQALSQANTGK
jgi:hypothetical protein